MEKLRLTRTSPELHEAQREDSDLQFAIDFARKAGDIMLRGRAKAKVSLKLDRTVVTDLDKRINLAFIEDAGEHSGVKSTVIGEEASSTEDTAGNKIWVIDPIDGTGEYIDDNVPDKERTSCVGLAMFEGADLKFSVVFNPFRDELFVADRNREHTLLNDQPIHVSKQPIVPGVDYDYCQWDGSLVDARFLDKILGKPLGSYSAIYQAMMVASGRSAFAIFPGKTVHDIAPGALAVELAGGTVTDLNGEPIDWSNPNGAIYSNGLDHESIVRALSASRES